MIDEQLSNGLGFPIDVDRVLQHLNQDMRDDWYYDALRYRDLFNDPTICKEVICSSLERGHGLYSSSTPTVRGIPKKGYTERYSLETDFFDRFVYQAAVSYLIRYIDPLLSNRVLSYRYEPYPTKAKYLFKNKIERWSTFEGIALTFRRSNAFLAVTDLSNFFEGISSERVCDRMISFIPSIEASGEEKSCIRTAIESIRWNMRKWSFQSGSGLPQNRDASSFLSNVALCDVDMAMVAKGYDYYRYVDDIRIICGSDAEARRSLTELTRELRRSGFSINGAKTEIMPPDASDSALEAVFTGLNKDIKAINNMWRSRSRRVVARSAKYICEIVKTSVIEQDTQSRSFRFAVNRLSQLVQAGIVSPSDTFIADLRSLLVETMYDHAVSTDQYCRILSAIDPRGEVCSGLADYLCDSNRSIYDWQNYNIWLLLARHRYTNGAILKRGSQVLKTSADSGEAAGVMIWAVAAGHHELITAMADSYLSMRSGADEEAWPYLNQRHFLIAMNFVGQEDLAKIRNTQHYKLDRTTSRTKRLIPDSGIPIIDPDPPELSLMIEEANDYT